MGVLMDFVLKTFLHENGNVIADELSASNPLPQN